jgi:hypothetical protein
LAAANSFTLWRLGFRLGCRPAFPLRHYLAATSGRAERKSGSSINGFTWDRADSYGGQCGTEQMT